MSNISNIPPKVFTVSAALFGLLLTDDLNTNEQNALGNWLMLASQVLCTNSAFMQLQNGINQGANNMGGIPNNQETVVMLEKMVRALQKEIQDIKNNL